MKKFLFVLISLFFLPLTAQIKPKQHDWFFYDISYDYLLNTPDALQQSWRSNGHSISILDDMRFGESNFGLGYGLGFMSNNYFNNLGIFTSLVDGNENFVLLDTDSIKNNKLNVQHLFIPIELRIRSTMNEDRKFFRLYIGARIGLRIKSYAQLKTDKATVQYKNLGSLNRFNYGIYTRIGYDHFSIYAYYGLSEMVKDGELMYSSSGSPEVLQLNKLRPLSIGISLSL